MSGAQAWPWACGLGLTAGDVGWLHVAEERKVNAAEEGVGLDLLCACSRPRFTSK